VQIIFILAIDKVGFIHTIIIVVKGKNMQCEAQITVYAPLRLGGTTSTKQCTNKATYVCTGKTKEEKLQPPMGLCDDCLLIFLKRNPDYKDTIKPI
jgi:hypothetical protein